MEWDSALERLRGLAGAAVAAPGDVAVRCDRVVRIDPPQRVQMPDVIDHAPDGRGKVALGAAGMDLRCPSDAAG
jgi:hypothetical protein